MRTETTMIDPKELGSADEEQTENSLAAHYLFENPDQFLKPEQQRWVGRKMIVHLAPPWLPIAPEGRKYGGIEDVIKNNILALDYFGAKSQIVIGHPDNVLFTDRLSRSASLSPNFLSPTVDYITMLRTEPERAMEIEREYLRWSHQILRGDSHAIIHDHNKGGRFSDLDTNRYFRPVIRTEHGPLTQPYISEAESAELDFFEQTNDSLGFVAISNDQMAQRPNINWRGVNHNGVDLADFEYGPKKDRDAPLVWMGRITSHKGTHRAIELAKRLQYPLLLVGEVDQTEGEEYFCKTIAPQIDNSLITHIRGADPKLRKEILRDARALIMLNEWREPFGMVMPEALASGTPIIGTNLGSIPEIVTPGTGYVVDSLNEAVDATKLIFSGQYSPEECRRTAEKRFSSLSMGSRYLDLLMLQELAFEQKGSYLYS